MSDFVEGVLNGDFCEMCGVIIHDPNTGFPRVCKSCWKGLSKSDKKKWEFRHEGCNHKSCKECYK